MEKSQFQHIVDATNHVHRILLETFKPSEDDFRKIFAVSCNTLGRIVAQAEFQEDLRELAIRQEQFKAEYAEITGNTDHFVEGFCYIERTVLIAAGVSEAAAESLIQEAINLRGHIKESGTKPEQVMRSLRKLRDEACGIAKQLHDLPYQRQEELKQKKKLKKFFFGIGGAAIVAADASAFAFTLGMSVAGTAVSGGFGCGLIGAALAIE